MFILIVVAILAVMVMYVIIPMLNTLEVKRDEYYSVYLEKMQVEALFAQENNIRDSRNAAVARHEMESSRFLDDSHSSEIGRMLTQLCQEYELMPMTLAIKDPVEFKIPSDDETTTAGQDNDTVFLITSATMTLNGNYLSLKSLLDAVGEIDYIRISSLTYSWEVPIEGVETPPDRITIDFELTTLKADDYEARVQEEAEDPWAILDEQER